MTCVNMGLSKSQTAPGLPRCQEEGRVPPSLRRLQETERRHEQRLFPNARDWWHSGHACWSQMVLHLGTEERICIWTTRRRLRSQRIKGNGSSQSCPLASATLQGRLNGQWWPSYEASRIMSHVPGWRNHDWLHVPRHLLNLRKVFPPFQEARLKLNLEKCQRFWEEVRYLANIMSPDRITTDP
jgi:hypothetical protein